MGRSRRLPHASRKRKVRSPQQVEDQRVTAPAAPPQITFIPKRINNAIEPGLHFFPLKILFGQPIRAKGSHGLAAALYEPHIASFTRRHKQLSLWYYNAHERGLGWLKLRSASRSRIRITCTQQADGSLIYYGEKFVNGIPVGSAAGRCAAADNDLGWRSFFFHLTILGISEREPCVVHNFHRFPPDWKEHLGLPAEMTKDVMDFQVISPNEKSTTSVASPPKAHAPCVKPESGVLV